MLVKCTSSTQNISIETGYELPLPLDHLPLRSKIFLINNFELWAWKLSTMWCMQVHLMRVGMLPTTALHEYLSMLYRVLKVFTTHRWSGRHEGTCGSDWNLSVILIESKSHNLASFCAELPHFDHELTNTSTPTCQDKQDGPWSLSKGCSSVELHAFWFSVHPWLDTLYQWLSFVTSFLMGHRSAAAIRPQQDWN